MADLQHESYAKQGAIAWNHWRLSNPKIIPNLSGSDLSGLDLSGADFNNANLSSTNFSGCDLSNANFIYANLTDTNFTDADLTDALFEKSEKVSPAATSTSKAASHPHSQARRYHALRTIQGLYRSLAYLVAIIAAIAAFIALAAASSNNNGAPPTLIYVVVLVGAAAAAVIVVSLLAVAESIAVFIDIEDNTRLSNNLLNKLIQKIE